MLSGKDEYGKSEEKRISGEAYDINKQTKYVAPKSKVESRAHYAPQPARGRKCSGTPLNNCAICCQVKGSPILDCRA